MTQIKDFEGYYITRCGEAYSTRKTSTPKKLSTKPDKNTGYIFVMFNMNGKTYRKTVHRLVAKAFIPNPQNLPEVNHKNGVKHDNRVSNLEWTDRVGNSLHSVNVLKKNFGEQIATSKLTEQDVLESVYQLLKLEDREMERDDD